jgi:hypothetical protein
MELFMHFPRMNPVFGMSKVPELIPGNWYVWSSLDATSALDVASTDSEASALDTASALDAPSALDEGSVPVLGSGGSAGEFAELEESSSSADEESSKQPHRARDTIAPRARNLFIATPPRLLYAATK